MKNSIEFLGVYLNLFQDKVLGFLFAFYRVFFRSIFGQCCCFQPSCSRYAEEAFSKHKLHRALFLVTYRLLRCHPFSQGGFDPVPDTNTHKVKSYG